MVYTAGAGSAGSSASRSAAASDRTGSVSDLRSDPGAESRTVSFTEPWSGTVPDSAGADPSVSA